MAAVDLWTIRQLAETPDPLKDFRFSSDAQRRVAENVARGTEVYWSAGNGSGKTTLGAALSVALARGLPELDGMALPRLQQPVTGLLIVPSLKQAAGSSLQIYRRMIGAVPHEEGRVHKAQDLVSMLWIKPDGWRNDDPQSWAKIMIFSREGEVPEGIRADFAHGDEPPGENIWRAVRFRAKPGKPFLRYVLATPLRAIEWRWLMRPDEFGSALNREVNGRLRIQSTVYDAVRSGANLHGHLSASDIRRAETDAASDQYGQARLSGQHVEPGAANPFSQEWLERTHAICKPPEEKRYVVQTEKDSTGGRHRAEVAVKVDTWSEYDEKERYLLVLDPSSGVLGHDPAALQVWARRRRALVALYDGPLAPWGMGSLAAKLAQDYGGALVDVEMTGGWGAAVLSALREAGYHNIARERYEERPGKVAERLGFQTTVQSRPRFIAALQRAMARNDIGVWSTRVVETLADCILDEKGRIAASSAGHDEHLILAARACHVMDNMRAEPYREPRTDTSFRNALARSIGQNPRRRPWKTPEAWD